MSTTATPVTPELEAYLRPLFWPEDALLQELARDIAARGPQIQVSAEEGRLLALLVTLSGAGRVLRMCLISTCRFGRPSLRIMKNDAEGVPVA